MSGDIDALSTADNFFDLPLLFATKTARGHRSLDQSEDCVFVVQNMNHETKITLGISRICMVFDVFAFQ